MKIERHAPGAGLKPPVKTFMTVESQSGTVSRVLPETSIVMAFRLKGGEGREAWALMRNTEQLVAVRELALTLLGEVESLAESPDSFPAQAEDRSFYEMVGEYEKFLIRRALLRAGGNQARAARMLRLRPTTLHNKIKAYNIKVDPRVMSCGRDAAAADCPESCAQSRGAA